MGQKVNPLGFRVGVYKGWQAKWFAPKSEYGNSIIQDLAIRRMIAKHIDICDLAEINIERAGDTVKVVLVSPKPGTLIGRKGQGVESLKGVFSKAFGKRFEFSIKEIKNPDLSAQLVAAAIADQIERRVSFKKVMKKVGLSVMRAGAKGVKFCLSGKLGGAVIARSEWFRSGSVPLHTLRSDIDYALVVATTMQGLIGVKVWICRGEF